MPFFGDLCKFMHTLMCYINDTYKQHYHQNNPNQQEKRQEKRDSKEAAKPHP